MALRDLGDAASELNAGEVLRAGESLHSGDGLYRLCLEPTAVALPRQPTFARATTGDPASARTAAWSCRTPGCPTTTRRTSGRCDGCRRARFTAGIGWAQFDAAPPPRVIRPLQPGRCTVPGCEGDLHCNGLCYRHEHSWRKKGTSEPAAAFIARARPLTRAPECRVAGCDRESATRRGLCRFHGQRLLRQHKVSSLSDDELAAWVASERPLLGAHQVPLAGLPELLRIELLYALQQRDQTPPPLDPTMVKMLLARLGDAAHCERPTRGLSASPAGCSTTRRCAGCSATSSQTPPPAPR